MEAIRASRGRRVPGRDKGGESVMEHRTDETGEGFGAAPGEAAPDEKHEPSGEGETTTATAVVEDAEQAKEEEETAAEPGEAAPEEEREPSGEGETATATAVVEDAEQAKEEEEEEEETASEPGEAASDEEREPSGGGETATASAVVEDAEQAKEEEETASEDETTPAAAAGGTTNGTAPSKDDDRVERYTDADLEGYRRRWDALLAGFVDDPRASVEQADALIGELVDRVSQRREQLRDELGRQDDRGQTEAMRLAIHRYR